MEYFKTNKKLFNRQIYNSLVFYIYKLWYNIEGEWMGYSGIARIKLLGGYV